MLQSVTLAPGDDVVLCSGCIFTDVVTIKGQGTPEQPIWIHTNGFSKAVFDADGQNLDSPGFMIRFPSNSAYIKFDNIEVKNVNGNNRGVFVNGDTITLTNCLIDHNGNGIVSGNEARYLLIDHCEVAYNGNNGLGHNIYTQGLKTTIQHSYIHDAQGGINVKDRSRHYGGEFFATELLYNYISSARAGGYEIDLSGRGTWETQSVRLLGNVIEAEITGNQRFMISYGSNQRGGELFAAYNTFKPSSPTQALIRSFDSRETTLVSNVWTGGRRLLIGSGYIYGWRNMLPVGTLQYSLANTVTDASQFSCAAWIAAIAYPEYEPPVVATSLLFDPVKRVDVGFAPGAFGGAGSCQRTW